MLLASRKSPPTLYLQPPGTHCNITGPRRTFENYKLIQCSPTLANPGKGGWAVWTWARGMNHLTCSDAVTHFHEHVEPTCQHSRSVHPHALHSEPLSSRCWRSQGIRITKNKSSVNYAHLSCCGIKSTAGLYTVAQQPGAS